MNDLLLVPLEDTVVFPGMNVTLTVDVGDEDRVVLVPRHESEYAAVGTVAEVTDRVRMRGGVRAVTLEDVTRVARTCLDPSKMAILVVGDRKIVESRLRSLPGIGVWTSAEIRQRAMGDPDAVSVGDYHLPNVVGWTLARRKTDDAGMLELLAPYAGHRYRVTRLIELGGSAPPRRGPRMSVRDYRSF